MRIVVSGIGIVTPLGSTRELTWSNLIAGKSGILRGNAGLEARVIDFSPNGARSRMGDFALLAAKEALRHAGFDPDSISGLNMGCSVSQSKPLMTDVLSSFSGWSAESIVQREFGLTGPSANVVAACATGIASIAMGVHWIEAGLTDFVLAGASESSLHPLYRAGFEQMGVLAKGEGPDVARPFDRHRSGFVMGEGAAVMVLESESSARRRGHAPLATLLAAQLSHSAADPIRFDPAGAAIARLISDVVKRVGRPDYINAHGTGTRFNDAAETNGIRAALKNEADQTPVSSTKAATGHLLGAAGAVEAAFSVLALRDQIIPPTLNLTTTDSDCDLDYVPHTAREAHLFKTLSLSYGFGGQLGAVHFGRC